MDKQKLIIMVGLARSGKSTLAKKLVEQGAKRVNKDLLREMFDFGVYNSVNERFVNDIKLQICNEILSNGNDCVVDDTNLYPKHIRELYDECVDFYDIHLYILNTPRQVCYEREQLTRNLISEEVFITQENLFNTYYLPLIDNRDLSIQVVIENCLFYDVVLNEFTMNVIWHRYLEEKNSKQDNINN